MRKGLKDNVQAALSRTNTPKHELITPNKESKNETVNEKASGKNIISNDLYLIGVRLTDELLGYNTITYQ